MGRRSYRQIRRAETTEATRQRILQAARDQLMSGAGFTIEAVAERAQVSRVTVYAQFGGRDALGEAVFDNLAETGGLAEIPSIFAEDDPGEGIGRLIDIFCGFYATHRPVLRRLHALAALAEGEGEQSADRNGRRRQILTALLSKTTHLPRYGGLNVETTVDILQALTSFEFYDGLAAGESTGIDSAQHIRKLASALLQP